MKSVGRPIWIAKPTAHPVDSPHRGRLDESNLHMSLRRPGRAIAALLAALILPATAANAAPPWWRVTDGRSEVWIIGVPQVTPKTLAWDTQSLDRRLTGASELIIAPQPRGGLKALVGLASNAGALRSKTPMEASLPPQLRRRFQAARESIGKDARAYADWKPAVAGTLLSGDFFRASNLEGGQIEAAARKLARRKGVREAPAGAYDASPTVNAAATLSEAGQEACLSATLRGVERGAASFRNEAEGWTRGLVRPAAAIDPYDQTCLAYIPVMKALSDSNLALDSNAVAAALRVSGHNVALFDTQSLTVSGGVLDRLRARGLSVTGPQP
jgi:uncharacterized protein YbaP (TraB family)